MTPFEWFGEVTRRIASATSVRRTREEDAVRLDVHGGPVDELSARAAAAAARLEKVASRLEAQA